jgi:hypothetical protein
MDDSLPPTKLLNNSKKLNIWFRYLAPKSVGRKISDVGDRERQVTGGNGRNPSGRKVLIFFGYRRFLA